MNYDEPKSCLWMCGTQLCERSVNHNKFGIGSGGGAPAAGSSVAAVPTTTEKKEEGTEELDYDIRFAL